MSKKAKDTPDFRSHRKLLPDEAFALLSGPRPRPTDLVSEETWSGIVHLPDDVALTTSSHHGAQLALLYQLWGDWLEAIGEEQDELFVGMLDAADCFQASTFDSLHGYYRSAISNLRSALELVAIGTLGNVVPGDADYIRWRKQSIGSLPFDSTLRKLRSPTKGKIPSDILKPRGEIEGLYNALCAYTHSRPDSSDGELWSSNGPIYVTRAFDLVFAMQSSAYIACYILSKIGRPEILMPVGSRFLTAKRKTASADGLASLYRAM